MTESPQIHYDPEKQVLTCEGDWDLSHFPEIKSSLDEFSWPKSGTVIFDGKAIKKMDSSGAWLLCDVRRKLEKKKIKVDLEGFTEEHAALIELIQERIGDDKEPPAPKKPKWLAEVGMYTIQQWKELTNYLNFVGRLTIESLRIGLNPFHWRTSSLVAVIYQTGYLALPIIALLSFMIGVVLTYQMGLQLRNYGANIYIVDLLGLAVTREFAPLLTAIMVAGRTGSAFTAQLGMMKLNEEIDALDTMGVTPAELLLLPRIIGLVIALPLLTMWADIFGIVGGMVMSNNMLSITWVDFLHRFPNVIPLRSFIIGIGKAPVFALIISSVGCFQGMQVEGSADSVGRNTTRSVVLSIFFIIVADAAFSIIFSKLKL